MIMPENSTGAPYGGICRQRQCCACCQDVRIRLTPGEHELLKQAGTSLRKAYVSMGLWDNPGAIQEYNDGKITYIMNGPCGLLENGLCSIYPDSGDPDRRPEVCATTVPGDEGCASSRKALGLESIIFIEGGSHQK